jgi:hypothetical protein
MTCQQDDGHKNNSDNNKHASITHNVIKVYSFHKRTILSLCSDNFETQTHRHTMTDLYLQPSFRAMSMVSEPSLVVPTTYGKQQQQLYNTKNDLQKSSVAISQTPATKATLIPNVAERSMETCNATKSTWKLPVLTRLCPFHPLECFHRHFPRKFLPVVLEQLSVSFRLASLKVQYHDSPVSALCDSMDQSRFVVSVWEDTNHDIVVEMQRICGDAIVFGRYARELMTSVVQAVAESSSSSSKQDYHHSASTSSKGAAPPSTHAPSVPRSHPFHHSVPFPTVLSHGIAFGTSSKNVMMMQINEDEEARSALEIAHRMLVSDRYDARQLGLDSLVLLTDPWQTGNGIATIVSQHLLLPCRQGNSSNCDLQSIVLSLALKGAWPVLGAPCAFEEEPASESHIYSALMALTHALQVLSAAMPTSESWLPSCFEHCLHLCQTDLVSCLIDRIVQASSRPHEAFYATLALVSLCQAQPSLTSRIPKPLIEQALMVGCSRHAALESASEQLLVFLTEQLHAH